MRFTAKYTSKTQPEYYRTIYADDIFEAIKLADRYTRKGFVCVSVKEVMFTN